MVFIEFYENPKLIKPTSELPLSGHNHLAYKKLFLRLEEFWEALLGSRTNLIVDSKLLSYLFDVLAIFCNSKIRSIRAVAVEIVNRLVTATVGTKVTAEVSERVVWSRSSRTTCTTEF